VTKAARQKKDKEIYVKSTKNAVGDNNPEMKADWKQADSGLGLQGLGCSTD